MKSLYLLLLIITASLITLGGSLQQQKKNPITGLWLIENVRVGDQQMTPVAKWTRIHEDGSFESGNGWLQNSAGTWTYDETAGTYAPEDPLGLEDPFGPFSVRFEGETMIWQREEEEMPVTITLTKINELPKAPADQVQGLWDLDAITQDETDITATYDPDNRNYLFFRWDRIYIARTPQGERATGYWHMNGHRPEVTLLPHSADIEPQSWRVEADDQELTLTGISDSNTGRTLVFKRISRFPD